MAAEFWKIKMKRIGEKNPVDGKIRQKQRRKE